MLQNIIIKELKNNLISLRFLLVICLTLVLMSISAVIFTGVYKYKVSEYNDAVNRNDDNLSKWSENLSGVAFENQITQIFPTPMEIVSEGGIKGLPTAIRFNAFRVYEPENISVQNKFMRNFSDIDWTFIITFILSFFAILLTYDSSCGEKNEGTLRLVLSNAVSRVQFISGKYLSALITVFLPLLLGIVTSLSIVIIYGNISFTSIQIGKLIIYLIASLFYLSIFVLLGLLVTSLTKNSITSVIILLFIWVLLAVLIPNSGGKIAAKLYAIPTREEIDRQITDRREEISNARRAEYPQTFRWSSNNPRAEWVPYRCRAVNEMADARNNINHDYMNRRISQIRRSKSLLKISPAVIFGNISDQICTTGLDRFESFYFQVYDFRKRFRQFIEDIDKMDTESFHCVYEWERQPMSQKPVDYNSIPRFQERELSIPDTIKKALSDFMLLIVFNGVLMILVFSAFLRYDVR